MPLSATPLTLGVQRAVEEGQQPRLPEGVAAVHQLVAAALKPTFKPHLPARHPLLRKRQRERRLSAKGDKASSRGQRGRERSCLSASCAHSSGALASDLVPLRPQTSMEHVSPLFRGPSMDLCSSLTQSAAFPQVQTGSGAERMKRCHAGL